MVVGERPGAVVGRPWPWVCSQGAAGARPNPWGHGQRPWGHRKGRGGAVRDRGGAARAVGA